MAIDPTTGGRPAAPFNPYEGWYTGTLVDTPFGLQPGLPTGSQPKPVWPETNQSVITAVPGVTVPATDAEALLNHTDLPPTTATVIQSPRQYAAAFNPPPHVTTNSLMVVRDKTPTQSKGNKKPEQQAEVEMDRYHKTSQLGFMVQDVVASESVNFNSKLRGGKSLWGFRFLYNPASISHNMTNDPSVDQSLPSIANQLVGTSTLSFDLFLNRLVDVYALPSYRRKGATMSITDAYGVSLSEEDILGIQLRGTAYDLDFLFRVCNGDPATQSPQLSDPGATADYGFLAGVPLWVQFNPNQRFMGYVTNLSITHGMFTEKMVPVMTTVSVSLARVPVVDQTDYGQLYDKTNEYRTTVNTDPNNSGDGSSGATSTPAPNAYGRTH